MDGGPAVEAPSSFCGGAGVGVASAMVVGGVGGGGQGRAK